MIHTAKQLKDKVRNSSKGNSDIIYNAELNISRVGM